ncbi:hypothetical protein DM02DRAFT_701132 [Periconia macrospinosa]|uniref:gamma-glutamylcyclotransferase n=1 Tax=Periconia macrospinosa TaxID=97972 RepID=A0A2V1DXL9_9PLEO|nr:hypothetical protein DM02DRAFT_701132 [Periconia macrospinosa]
MEEKKKTLWYFAYGSNMSTAKFTGSRGIVPLDKTLVRLPGWMLAMQIPGLPYSEPAFSSISPQPVAKPETSMNPDVVGVAYLITEDQYNHVIGSEGGGTAYNDISLLGRIIGEEAKGGNGSMEIPVRTLGTAMKRQPCPVPSARYMDLLISGGREACLPPDYQQYLLSMSVYEPPKSNWTKLGALVFLTIWGPVMQMLEKLTLKSIGRDGHAQWHVIYLVRFVMCIIWASHDYLFAPLFGRGDGLHPDDENKELA